MVASNIYLHIQAGYLTELTWDTFSGCRDTTRATFPAESIVTEVSE